MSAYKWSKRAINALTVLAVLALSVGLTHAQGPEPPEELDGVAVGFDGDGDADLAIGVPYEDVGTIEAAGAVNILNGYSDGLTPSGDQLWYQDVTYMVDEAEEDDYFGEALAVGDFDGDGYADLAIGVPGEAVDAFAGAGAVHVIYGTVDKLTVTGNQMFTQNYGSIQDDAEQGDHFGQTLAAGDFNGDGYDDLAIGVPYEDLGAIDNAGAVNVIYGSGGGLTEYNDQLWHMDTDGVLDFAEEGDQFGSALAAGDFDDDGYDDLAIGVPYKDFGTLEDVGSVHIIYGTASRLSADGNQRWHQNIYGIEGSAGEDDHFGWALAAGDFDGDGCDDLAIGVPGEDIGSIESAGAVNVIYGSVGGLFYSGDQLWHQDVTDVADSAETVDMFGIALAAGDFDRDGYDDLAVGMPYENVGTFTDAGAVHVFYGADDGLTAVGNWWFHQDSTGILDYAESFDNFGYALATGDFNGDFYADLAIGVPYEGVGDIEGAGAASVVYGSASGLSIDGDQFWHQDSPYIEGVAEAGDCFGEALAASPMKIHRVHLPLVVRNH
jgi:hypothetical protein